MDTNGGVAALSPPVQRVAKRKRRRRERRGDSFLYESGIHKIKPAYLFECVLRLGLVTLPRIVFRKYPAVPRLVSFGFLYIMLQLLGIHYAFLINAATSITLDVSGYAVARAFDATGFGLGETVAAVASAYTFYASLRLVTHFGSHIAAVAWGCVDDFPDIRQVVIKAGRRPFLLPVLFLPQLLLAALLVAAPAVCDPFSAEIVSAGGGHPFSLGYDPVLADAEWRQGTSEVMHRASHFACTRTPLMYLSRPYERPRQTLQMLLTISLLQYLQVLLQRYPSWRRDLRRAGLRKRLAVHTGLLANVALSSLWTVSWAGHFLGLDVWGSRFLENYMDAGLVLVLTWTALLAALAHFLSKSATSPGPDADGLRGYMTNLKASFLLGCAAVFMRGCLHPEMGFLSAQEEVTILTVAMPMLYVMTYMLLEACLGINRWLVLAAPLLSVVAAFICRISRFGGPGTLLLVWLHLIRKAIEHFGDTGSQLCGIQGVTDAQRAERGDGAKEPEQEESVFVAAYREALQFLKSEASAAAAEAASGSEMDSSAAAATFGGGGYATDVGSVSDTDGPSSAAAAGAAEGAGESENSASLRNGNNFDSESSSTGGEEPPEVLEGGGGSGGKRGVCGASGVCDDGNGSEALGLISGLCRSGGDANGNGLQLHEARNGHDASAEELHWDSSMLALAEAEGIAPVTERWRRSSVAAAAKVLAAVAEEEAPPEVSIGREGSATEDGGSAEQVVNAVIQRSESNAGSDVDDAIAAVAAALPPCSQGPAASAANENGGSTILRREAVNGDGTAAAAAASVAPTLDVVEERERSVSSGSAPWWAWALWRRRDSAGADSAASAEIGGERERQAIDRANLTQEGSSAIRPQRLPLHNGTVQLFGELDGAGGSGGGASKQEGGAAAALHSNGERSHLDDTAVAASNANSGSTAMAIGSALLHAPARGRESLNAALASLVARMEAAAPHPSLFRSGGGGGVGSNRANGKGGRQQGGSGDSGSGGWLRGVQAVYEDTDTRFLYRSVVSVAALILLALGSSVAIGGLLSHVQERVKFYPNFMSINTTATGQVVISHAFASTATLETQGPVVTEEPNYAACGVRWHGLSLIDYALLAELAYVELDRVGPQRRQQLLDTLFPAKAGFDFEIRIPPEESNGGRPRASFFEVHSPSLNLSVIAIRGTDLGRVGDFLEDWKTWVSPIVMACLSTLFPTIQIWPKETTAAVVLWMDETLEVFGVQPRPDYFRPLVEYVRSVDRGSASGCNVVMTGHSLGGGLARIVGALLKKSSICFSPPGVAQSYRKFRVDGAMLDKRFLLHTSVSVIPENDLVTKIDTQVGLIQTIQCATSSKALQNSCHMLEGTLCDLVQHCGDDRGRFVGCNYEFSVAKGVAWLRDLIKTGARTWMWGGRA